VFAMLAQLVIQGLALPMVQHFGQGNNAKGYQTTMGIFSALAVVFFFITFAATKERIQPPPGQDTSVRRHAADLLKNGPWLVMFVVTLVLFITLSMRGSVVLYYFNYYVSKQALLPILGALGLSATTATGAADHVRNVSFAFSAFNVLGTTSTIVGIFFSKRLALRYGKRNVFIGGLAGTALFTSVFLFLPPGAVVLMFASEMLRQFVYGFTIPLLWAMMADVADFSEWKTGRRATGMVFAAIVFALKAGLGFGGAITGYVLSLYGYVPNVPQAAGTLDGIRYTMSVFPAVTFAVCAACLCFYRIDRRSEIQMAGELAERRRLSASHGA
jgi:GPH family glycoside/pentoside/hexuronide:cation symporter